MVNVDVRARRGGQVVWGSGAAGVASWCLPPSNCAVVARVRLNVSLQTRTAGDTVTDQARSLHPKLNPTR